MEGEQKSVKQRASGGDVRRGAQRFQETRKWPAWLESSTQREERRGLELVRGWGRGDKAGLLSSHFAWLLLALTCTAPRGNCHGVAGLQASALLRLWLGPPPCGCLALLPSLACGRFACHFPGSSAAP